MNDTTTTTPPRGCDGCTLCCRLIGVSDLGKAAGDTCRHCSPGKGCDIQGTAERPASCGAYECVWLMSQRAAHPLPLELRPDACHVIIGTTLDGERMVFYVDPRRPDAYKRGPINALIEGEVARGGTVFLVIGSIRRAIGRDAPDLVRQVALVQRAGMVALGTGIGTAGAHAGHDAPPLHWHGAEAAGFVLAASVLWWAAGRLVAGIRRGVARCSWAALLSLAVVSCGGGGGDDEEAAAPDVPPSPPLNCHLRPEVCK